MKNEVKRIIKKLGLWDNVLKIEIKENNFMYYAKIITISFKNHNDKAKIILTAYNKKEFAKNTYTKEIERQILENKYLFEAV